MQNPSESLPSAPANHPCETNLLDDVPTKVDAFTKTGEKTGHARQGPHQTVAEAIAQLVTSANPKGISIGLEGSWGSGKTTVVNLLRERLKAARDVRLISFDAWAHEGDPLRRTFLETIIRHLKADEPPWVDRAKWGLKVEELARRREVVESKDAPVMSRFAKFALATPLFVPLGAALFVQAMRGVESVDLWLLHLRNNGELLALAAWLREAEGGDVQVVAEDDYFLALMAYAKEILEGFTPPSERKDLAQILTEGGVPRRRLRPELLGLLLRNASGDVPVAFFNIFGAEISDPELLLEHAEHLPRSFDAMLQHKGKNPALKWFVGLLKTNPSLLGKLHPEIVKAMMGAVERARATNGDDDLISELVNIFGLIHSTGDIASAYENRLRQMVGLMLKDSSNIEDVEKLLSHMLSNEDFFSAPDQPSPSGADYFAARIRKLAEVPIIDEEGLRVQLTNVLQGVLSELHSYDSLSETERGALISQLLEGSKNTGATGEGSGDAGAEGA